MQEAINYKIVKDFLSFNNINFSDGFVIKEFYFEYFIDIKLRHRGNSRIKFQVQHPEFTGFNAKFQIYKFDEKENVFVINSKNSNNKFRKNYEVRIYG